MQGQNYPLSYVYSKKCNPKLSLFLQEILLKEHAHYVGVFCRPCEHNAR